MTAAFGDNSSRAQLQDDFQSFRVFSFQAPGVKSTFLADLFGTLSFTAQHGNFQKLFLDLSRFHARLDFPSGSKFISGATRLAQDFFNSQQPSMQALQAVCPNATLSFQQQVCDFPHPRFCIVIEVSSVVMDRCHFREEESQLC